jgi:putative ABC transport system permease protein
MLRFLPLLLANLQRRPLRTLLTVASVAAAFLMYGLLEALRYALTGGVELTGHDRLITMHKVSLTQSLPFSYAARIAGVDGVRAVCPLHWFGGVYRDERGVVIAMVVDPDRFLEVYPEILLPKEQRRAWLAERTGALVGQALAQAHGWKVGDIIPLRSSIYRQRGGGDTWPLKISGIYRIRDDAGDTNNLYLQYPYFNENLAYGRDTIGWLGVRIRNPDQAALIARRIDATFANSFAETKTSTERAFAQGFVNQVGNVGAIISAIVTAVLFTMLLVTANTMAQSVRERTGELGVLKTLGFTSTQVLALVLAESLLVTAGGALIGMGFATVITRAAARSLQQYLPLLAIQPRAWLGAAGLVLALGLVAGLLPGWQAWRLRITQALQRA